MAQDTLKSEIDMEIVTTVQELPQEIEKFHLEPDMQIRLIVEDSQKKIPKEKTSGRRFPFLDSPVWEGNEGDPTDISANVDHYLYDVEEPHGKQ